MVSWPELQPSTRLVAVMRQVCAQAVKPAYGCTPRCSLQTWEHRQGYGSKRSLPVQTRHNTCGFQRWLWAQLRYGSWTQPLWITLHSDYTGFTDFFPNEHKCMEMSNSISSARLESLRKSDVIKTGMWLGPGTTLWFESILNRLFLCLNIFLLRY